MEFSERYGDWGRDLALVLGRREGGMRLTELGEKVGGLDYATVAAALRRMKGRLENDPDLATLYEKIRKRL